MKLLDIVISEDYKTQYKKFTEKEGVDPEIVKSYLKYFKKIRDKYPKQVENAKIRLDIEPDKRKDIDAYKSFKDLELIVDYVRGQVDIEDVEVEVTNDHTIYEDDKLKISRGLSADACIKIKGSEKVSWCVARNNKSQNLYTHYRMLPERESTFYFVQNKTKSKNNKYYFFVIQRTKNGGYIITSAENDGDVGMTWDEIVKIEPLLTTHKDLFKYYPVTSDERASSGFKNLTDEQYGKLTYRHKKLYIDGKFPLNDFKFSHTPMDLITYYINTGGFLTTEQEIYLEKNNPKLLVRYKELVKRAIGNNEFLISLYKYDNGEREIDLGTFKGGEIILGIDSKWDTRLYLDLVKGGKDKFLGEADINEWELGYLEGIASRYHDRDWDSSDLDYMWGTLDTEVQTAMIKLLKVMGVPKSKLDRLDEEKILKEILDNFQFGKKIMEEYMSEYASLVRVAETEEASSMLEKYYELPFEFDGGEMVVINDISEFITAIVALDPTIDNFETAIIELLKTTELDGDITNIEYYGREDYTELNREMLRTIERVMDDLDGDYSEYYSKIMTTLEKLGFDEDDRVENDIVSIEILDKLPLDLEDDEQLEDPVLTVKITNKKTNKEETGNIKLSSLPNYVNNYQLFDEVKRFKSLTALYL